MRRRIVLAVVCAALLLAGCGANPQVILERLRQAPPEKTETARVERVQPEPPADGRWRYYYEKLSPQEQTLYLQICDAVESFTPTLEDVFGDMSVAQVCDVVNCVGFDNPQYFWLSDGFHYYYTDETVVRLELRYLYSAEEVTQMQAEIDAASDALRGMILPEMTEFDKFVALHDGLVEWMSYAVSEEQAQKPEASNLYGALVERSALCGGYAKAYQYLCAAAGLDASFLTGQADGVDHAWNFVRLGGTCYDVDVTWDDPVGQQESGAVSHDYCLADAALLRQTHTPDSKWLPAYVGQDQTYFKYCGLYLESYEQETFAAQLGAAAAAGEPALTVQFATEAVADEACAQLLEQGALYDALEQAQWENAALVTNTASYSRDEAMQTLTVYLEYQ